jgi:hypothetical protein
MPCTLYKTGEVHRSTEDSHTQHWKTLYGRWRLDGIDCGADRRLQSREAIKPRRVVVIQK